MLATNSKLHAPSRPPSIGTGDLHEASNAGSIEGRKGIVGHDLLVDVLGNKAAAVVAADAVGRLGQVVRTEAKELGSLGNFPSGESGTGQLDHGAHQVGHAEALLLEDLRGDLVNDGGLEFELLGRADQRNHDLGARHDAGVLGHLAGGLKQGPGLHARDLGEGDPQAATAVTKHRVELVQAGDLCAQGLCRNAEVLRELALLPRLVGKEFVQGWVEGSDRNGTIFHGPEDALEVLALERQQLSECLLAALLIGGQDHLAHGVNLAALEEHVLGARQTHALGAEGDGRLALVGLIRIGADAKGAIFVSPGHQLLIGEHGLVCLALARAKQVPQHVGRRRLERAVQHLTRGPIQGDLVPLADGATIHNHDRFLVVDQALACTRHADLAHLPSHESGVTRHAATGG